MSSNEKSLDLLKILVAEDARDIRMLFNRLLTRKGAVIVEAADGQDALNKVKLEAFDLILMDLEMPVMSGYDSAPLMRAAGYEGPIIALTGHSVDQIEGSKASFQGFLQKPVATDLLITTILSHCKK